MARVVDLAAATHTTHHQSADWQVCWEAATLPFVFLILSGEAKRGGPWFMAAGELSTGTGVPSEPGPLFNSKHFLTLLILRVKK